MARRKSQPKTSANEGCGAKALPSRTSLVAKVADVSPASPSSLAIDLVMNQIPAVSQREMDAVRRIFGDDPREVLNNMLKS